MQMQINVVLIKDPGTEQCKYQIKIYPKLLELQPLRIPNK